MIKKLLLLILFLGSISFQAQNVWRTTIDDAIKASNEQRKPMLIFFTALGVPNNLQNEVFNTPDFVIWSRDNVILVKLDLSDNNNVADYDKEQNLKLKNAFGVQELPQVCFAKASIRKSKTTFQALGKSGYKPGGVRAWISESDAILNPSEE